MERRDDTLSGIKLTLVPELGGCQVQGHSLKMEFLASRICLEGESEYDAYRV